MHQMVAEEEAVQTEVEAAMQTAVTTQAGRDACGQHSRIVEEVTEDWWKYEVAVAVLVER